MRTWPGARPKIGGKPNWRGRWHWIIKRDHKGHIYDRWWQWDRGVGPTVIQLQRRRRHK